jgi:hypothetical protein
MGRGERANIALEAICIAAGTSRSWMSIKIAKTLTPRIHLFTNRWSLVVLERSTRWPLQGNLLLLLPLLVGEGLAQLLLLLLRQVGRDDLKVVAL